MDDIIDSTPQRTKEQKEYTRYWAGKTSEERIAETWRLSVEKYGQPKTSLRDGPFRLVRRNANGKEEMIELTSNRALDKQPKV